MNLALVITVPQCIKFFDGQIDYLISKGINITIYTSNNEYLKHYIEKYPKVKFKIILFAREISLIKDFKALFQLSYAFLTERPDIVHLHTPKASLLGGLAGRLCFVPRILYTIHGLVSLDKGRFKKGLVYKMEKLTSRLAHEVFSVSKSVAIYAEKQQFVSKAKSIQVINNGSFNGIDFDYKFHPERYKPSESCKKLGLFSSFIEHQVVTFGFVARVCKDKGVFDLIDVWSSFVQKQPRCKLIIAGAMELVENDLARFNSFLDENTDTVRYVGELTNTAEVFNVIDCLLFPSYREGFGLVVSEAGAMTKPCVAYDIPGVKDTIVNGQTGYRVEVANLVAFEHAMNGYLNPEIRKIHGRAAREYVINHFSHHDILVSLEIIYLKSEVVC